MEERDTIFMLLALTIAADDFHRVEARPRMRNIAAVLVDPDGDPVCWARNAVARTGDPTQHAEVRALTRFFAHADAREARGHTLYATLEPCAMCAGMAIMSSVARVVYAEVPGASGDVFARLAHDASGEGGPCPYYHVPISGRWRHPIADRPAEARRAIADPWAWEGSEARAALFFEAKSALASFALVHPENTRALAAARRFAALVPFPDPVVDTGVECPPAEAATEPTGDRRTP